MQSNEFDLNQTVNATLQDKDWYQKVQCVASLSKTKLFKDLQTDAAKLILDILKTPTDKFFSCGEYVIGSNFM
jgi:hypothetical protein